ncbi:MAG: thioredoxin family protein [Opitutales bacterium]|nr:thioredoxin family protein [Opitutales bacterium]
MKTNYISGAALLFAAAFLTSACEEKTNGVPATTEEVAVPAAVETPAPAETMHSTLWLTDFNTARSRAAEEGKDLFVFFTGSDWCGYCVELDKNILEKPGFLEKVSEKFVPVVIDFPKAKEKITKEQAERNEALATKYNIHGFPTILLMDSAGIVFGQMGYDKCTPEQYLENLAITASQGKGSDRYLVRKQLSEVPADAPDRVARLDAILSKCSSQRHSENRLAVVEVLQADTTGTAIDKYPFFRDVLPIEKDFRKWDDMIEEKALESINSFGVRRDETAIRKIYKDTISANIEPVKDFIGRLEAAHAKNPDDEFIQEYTTMMQREIEKVYKFVEE